MKKLMASVLLLTTVCSSTFAQTTETVETPAPRIRPAAIGVSFALYDFRSAELIRNSSLTTVMKNKQLSKLNQMDPGLTVTFFKGLKSHVDFAGSLSGTFVNLELEGRDATDDDFMVSADASVNLKMLPDSYAFTPYVNLGVGASIYDSKFGAFLPLGLGLKFNLFNEASIFLNTQYRVPVTTNTAAYHFYHGIGISGVIGK